MSLFVNDGQSPLDAAGLSATQHEAVDHTAAPLSLLDQTAHDALDHTGVTGVGKVVQTLFDTNNANTALGTIPFDGTAPQNTEGDEILSVTITPTSSSSVLVIEVVVYMGQDAGSGDHRILALFLDAGTSAISAVAHFDASGEMVPVKLRHFVTSPTTSSQTWRIRAGSNNGNAALNRTVSQANPLGAGLIFSSMSVTEYAP